MRTKEEIQYELEDAVDYNRVSKDDASTHPWPGCVEEIKTQEEEIEALKYELANLK